MAEEIPRDQRQVVALHDPERHLLRAVAQDLVDRLDTGRRTLGGEGQVHQRDVRRRHPHRQAIQAPGQLRQHQADGLGRAGGRRNHRLRRGAGAVEILVCLVQQVLVVGVGMHGIEQPLANADRLMQHLGQRRQAVGGAGGVGHHPLTAQQFVVDAIDHGQVGAIERVRSEHPLGAGLQMLVDQRARLELARAFQHHVDAKLLPGQLRGVALLQ